MYLLARAIEKYKSETGRIIIQNTNRQNIPQKDKDKIIDYYTHDMSQDQLNALHDSQVKLKRLERGDF